MDEERRRFGPPASVEEAPAAPGPDALPESEPLDWPLADEPAVSGTPVAEAEDDEEPRVGFLAGLIGYKRRERWAARLRKLDRAIDAAPDAPANYLLRGELRLKLGERDAAAADFQKALALADRAFATSDWGLVAQGVADRALAGLRRAGYRLRPIER